MNKRDTSRKSGFGRLLDLEQLREYLNMGRDRSKGFAENCGAAVIVGRSVRYDREILDRAVDAMHVSKEESEGG